VGGASRRMGGAAKGLLRLANGETLVDRWLRLFDRLGVECVLVGVRPEYAPRRMLADAPECEGPLAGLVALLHQGKASGARHVLAVGCDMPHVSDALVSRLLAAPHAPAIAAKREGRWEPMLARYEVEPSLAIARARAARDDTSLHGLLEALAAVPLDLSLSESRELDDWDTPGDVERSPA